MSSHSRHSDRQRHSGNDYSRSSRSSHSSKRSEDRVKRRERDRDHERRKERRRSNERSSDRKYAPREESQKSRNHDNRKEESKLSRSRSKADRTYNTDTEESDESSESPGRNFKKRHSSDHDDDKLSSDDEMTSNKTFSNQLLIKDKGTDKIRRPNNGERNSKADISEKVSIRPVLPNSRDIDCKSSGPRLPPQLRAGEPQNEIKSVGSPNLERKDSFSTSEDESMATHLQRKGLLEESATLGPVLPPHLKRKGSSDSEEERASVGPALPSSAPKIVLDDDNCIGPVLPPNLKRKGSSDSEEESVGPALPPSALKNDSDGDECIGPVLPQLKRKDSSDREEERASVGPALPPSALKNDSDDDECIGPVLPRHLKRRGSSDREEERASGGPALPPSALKIDSDDDECIGPVLPRHLKRRGSSDSEEERVSGGPALPTSAEKNDSDDDKCIGPVLPPHLRLRNPPDIQNELASMGPALPPGLKQNSSRTLGPSLPPGMNLTAAIPSEDSDDGVVGPMLPEELMQSNKNYLVHAQLERRAAEVKRKLEEKDLGPEATKREQWMLELPPEGTIDLGLGPRTFRVKGAPEKGADRSMWTDTPADKLRKQEQAAVEAQCEGTSRGAEIPPEISLRDKEMEKVVKKHSKKRGKESLLDLHQKEINKKKKKDKDDRKKEERRPFSREVDLKTNVFDEAQKKSIFKKAQLLDTRFSRGETKYL